MAVDADSFLQLCKQLRALGAVKVEGYGFSAVFVLERAAAARAPAKEPRELPMDPAKLRELQRQRELGNA